MPSIRPMKGRASSPNSTAVAPRSSRRRRPHGRFIDLNEIWQTHEDFMVESSWRDDCLGGTPRLFKASGIEEFLRSMQKRSKLSPQSLR